MVENNSSHLHSPKVSERISLFLGISQTPVLDSYAHIHFYKEIFTIFDVCNITDTFKHYYLFHKRLPNGKSEHKLQGFLYIESM